MQPPVGLIADIGGTNARFGLVAGDGTIENIQVKQCRDYPDVLAALADYADGATLPPRAALCAAGPVIDGRVRLTNHVWTVDQAEISEGAGFEAVAVVNDFVALSMAVPDLTAGDLFHVCGDAPVDGAPIAVMGPGTGLGVSAYLPGVPGGHAVAGEGGHMTVGARAPDEEIVVDALQERYGHVSYERVLSGQGLENIYRALAAADGKDASPSAEQITRSGLDGSDPLSLRTLECFFAFLGTAASDVTLVFGAQGGVLFAGGILPRLTSVIGGSAFHKRFIDKGRFRDYLERVPVDIVTHPYPAFLGLKRLVSG